MKVKGERNEKQKKKNRKGSEHEANRKQSKSKQKANRKETLGSIIRPCQTYRKKNRT